MPGMCVYICAYIRVPCIRAYFVKWLLHSVLIKTEYTDSWYIASLRVVSGIEASLYSVCLDTCSASQIESFFLHRANTIGDNL